MMNLDKKIFFDEYRKNLDIDNRLTKKEVNALDIFLDLFVKSISEFSLHGWAYIFATVFHETAFTFEPVIEAFNMSENWRKRNLRYFPYYGRGYVQLTWERNYKVFSKLLKKDLVKHPEIACDYENAFDILIIGCKNGLFTGKKIDDYIKNGKPNYKEMRRVINGNDKSETIADYANEFYKILKLSVKWGNY